MKFFRSLLASALAVASTALAADREPLPVYMDEDQPIEARVADALSRMTTAEKIAIIHAQSKFSSPGVERLGIPELWCDDGPHGVRAETLWDAWADAEWTSDSVIAFPALTCLAATWNPEMAALYGNAIGEEARYRKKDVLLGPGVNMMRIPICGRNFEYMGEDPFLTSAICVPYIKGIQNNGVAACVKHLALNNDEVYRFNVNVDVDDRALYEIYLPAFKAAVTKGGVMTVMSSFNLYQNRHTSQNRRLMNDILRGEWGFDGCVISDWGAVHDTEQAITSGIDLEFGSHTDGLIRNTPNAYNDYFLARPYLKLIQEGRYGTAELDEKAANVLRLIMRTSMNSRKPWGSKNTEAHRDVAHRVGAEGIVLLKNDKSLLPLSPGGKQKKIAVIGENAVKMMTTMGGSSKLKAKYETAPLDGIVRAAKGKADVVFARGFVGDTVGYYYLEGEKYLLSEKRSPEELRREAADVARDADVVILFSGLCKKRYQDAEGSDRRDVGEQVPFYGLPYQQDELIEAVVDANPNTVIVNISGNPVAMPWIDRVPAILQAWYQGSEGGDVIAEVLTGEINPSGKLPYTWSKSLDEVGAMKHYPGKWRHNTGPMPVYVNHINDTIDQKYGEGIFIGYRWADKHAVKPHFPFGHGLSYTTFKYGKPALSSSRMTAGDTIYVTVPVTNTGSMAGAEVVQLYIADKESALERPVKELKGFGKVFLQPGETRSVTLPIDRESLQYFDPDRHQWVVEPGRFEALIGSSSRDIRAKLPFTVN